ncbi:MAG: PD-(D/E)XK nuclease family protein [Candidatus Cryptobacteroides sp.]|jgi:hypothetical protein
MDHDYPHIKRLLASVESINKRYAEVKKAYEESGVMYNVFDVLGLSTSEVRLHSAFIASILGSSFHGAGNAFLKAFLKIPALSLPENYFELDRVTVEQEKYIPPKEKTPGGRIDLYITDGKNSITIENKIYARDVKNQLLRYHNLVPNSRLIYLTLFGNKPSKESLGELDDNAYICLSYKYDIVHWLEECVLLAANLPYVRETLNQYIKTLKQLTDSNMGTNAEIVKLLSKEENISAAFAIRENLDESLNTILNGFIDSLKKKLEEIGSPFSCTIERGNWLQKYKKIIFENNSWNNICFSAEFQADGLRGMIVGLILIKKPHVKDITQLGDAVELSKRLGYKNSSALWYYNNYVPANWNNAEVMKSLLDGTMVENFIKMLNNVSKCADGLNNL